MLVHHDWSKPVNSTVVIHNQCILVCDHCQKTEALQPDFDPHRPVVLPGSWERVVLPGWAGYFHACSKEHRERLTDKYRS